MMHSGRYSVIVGSGSYLPERVVPNREFHYRNFLDQEGNPFDRTAEEIVQKFEDITEIRERRYVSDDLNCSDIAYLAAQEALESSGIDRESLDYIIVAQNWADVPADNRRSDQLPSIASRVKHRLEINNPWCVAYDLPFGCPGWVQGLIQADYYLRSGDARRALVIGAETLSRICDPYDRDSMIYADGAAAVILEAKESEERVGIQAHVTRTDARHHAYLLWQAESFAPNRFPARDIFLKMDGRKLYRYALAHVPDVVKRSLDKAGIHLSDVRKVLIHQANAKMDTAILQRLFTLYGMEEMPHSLMPMTISWLGNSSVATVPTLYDLIAKGKMEGHAFHPGDWIVLASVGAGMNVNSVVYRVP